MKSLLRVVARLFIITELFKSSVLYSMLIVEVGYLSHPFIWASALIRFHNLDLTMASTIHRFHNLDLPLNSWTDCLMFEFFCRGMATMLGSGRALGRFFLRNFEEMLSFLHRPGSSLWSQPRKHAVWNVSLSGNCLAWTSSIRVNKEFHCPSHMGIYDNSFGKPNVGWSHLTVRVFLIAFCDTLFFSDCLLSTTSFLHA